MKIITGISLVLDTGEEIKFGIDELNDVGIYDIVEIVKQIGPNIVEFKQAGSFYIEISEKGNYTYSPFGIGEPTTVFSRLLMDEDVQIAKVLKLYNDGSAEEIYSPDDEVQEIYEDNNKLCIDVYMVNLSDSEFDFE